MDAHEASPISRSRMKGTLVRLGLLVVQHVRSDLARRTQSRPSGGDLESAGRRSNRSLDACSIVRDISRAARNISPPAPFRGATLRRGASGSENPGFRLQRMAECMPEIEQGARARGLALIIRYDVRLCRRRCCATASS